MAGVTMILNFINVNPDLFIELRERLVPITLKGLRPRFMTGSD